MNLFVYGTLKTDCCNHHVLRRIIGDVQRPVQVRSLEKYPMYKSEYYFPYLEDQKGIGEYIVGQIVEIPDDRLDELDRFEGVPTLYKRGTIMVGSGNVELECLCYFKAFNSDLYGKTLISEWVE